MDVEFYATQSPWPVNRMVVALCSEGIVPRGWGQVFLVPDSDSTWHGSFEFTLPDVPDEELDLDMDQFLTDQVLEIARNLIRQRIREVWQDKNHPPPTPELEFDPISESAILALRLRGHGEEGLRNMAENLKDEAIRERIEAILQFDPITVERRGG